MEAIIKPQSYKIAYYSKVTNFDIDTMHLCQHIKEEFGSRFLKGTIIMDSQRGCMEDVLRYILSKASPQNILEIGTYLGTSTLFLSFFCDKITTIDIVPMTDPVTLWGHFNKQEKIDFYAIRDNEVKKNLIDKAEFDFALVDGDHSYEGVRYDFELVKKCGKVLFHDYQIKPGVTQFIEELPAEEITKFTPFAYWEKK